MGLQMAMVMLMVMLMATATTDLASREFCHFQMFKPRHCASRDCASREQLVAPATILVLFTRDEAF